MVAVDGERHGSLLHCVCIVTNFLLFGDQGDSYLLKIGIVVWFCDSRKWRSFIARGY